MNRREFNVFSVEKAISSIESLPIPAAEKQRILGGKALAILNTA